MTDEVSLMLFTWTAFVALCLMYAAFSSEYSRRRKRRTSDDGRVLTQYSMDTVVRGTDPARGDISLLDLRSATMLPDRRLRRALGRLAKQGVIDRCEHGPTGQVRYRLTMTGRFQLAPRRGLWSGRGRRRA